MSFFDGAPFERCKLLVEYTRFFTRRTQEGFFDDLRVKVGRKEYLQLMYETHLYRGVAASGETLVWAPWPTDPNQDLPVTVEIRLSGGRLIFECEAEPAHPERKPGPITP